MSQSNDRSELTSLETGLANLAPAAALNRDQVFFHAGRASAPRGWLWRAVSATFAVISIALGLMLWLRPEPAVVERVVYVPVSPETKPDSEPKPAPEPPSWEPPAWRPNVPYYQVQDQVLRFGLDGLPEPPPPRPMPPIDNLLGL